VFVSPPVNGAIYVARPRERGGKLLIWTRVPIAPRPRGAGRGDRGAASP